VRRGYRTHRGGPVFWRGGSVPRSACQDERDCHDRCNNNDGGSDNDQLRVLHPAWHRIFPLFLAPCFYPPESGALGPVERSGNSGAPIVSRIRNVVIRGSGIVSYDGWVPPGPAPLRGWTMRDRRTLFSRLGLPCFVSPLGFLPDRHVLCSTKGSYRTNGSVRSVRLLVAGQRDGRWEGGS
jgi:hypothetical protein